jgi:solute carrier family 25 glutamate transporter 18/22
LLSVLFFLEGKTVPKVSATLLARELVATKGILGLYRGIGATAMRDVTFSIIYFPMFARLNSLGPRKKDGSGIYLQILLTNYP